MFMLNKLTFAMVGEGMLHKSLTSTRRTFVGKPNCCEGGIFNFTVYSILTLLFKMPYIVCTCIY